MNKIIIDGVTYVRQRESDAMRTVGVRLPLKIIELLEKESDKLGVPKTTLMRSYICEKLMS
tara:strand:- start:712 stop:894 length:183 start_codon:yes stop_codon:yes gene_type:complete